MWQKKKREREIETCGHEWRSGENDDNEHHDDVTWRDFS